MTTVEKITQAIKYVNDGLSTQYINVGDKVIRVGDHGANPSRTDYNLISLVVDNDGQSYRQDRGRFRTTWENSNEWYVNSDGDFNETFDSMERFLSHFDIEE